MTTRLVEHRTPAWAGMTTQFDHGVTAAEALREASIDDPVTKAPLYALDEASGEFVEIPGKFAMMNLERGSYFGTCGPNYSFLQNEELAAILDAELTRHYPVIAAGETPNGGGVMFLLDAGERNVAGERVQQYFLAADARTVGHAFRWAFTPLRFSCLNTLMTAFHQATALVAARHDRQFSASVTGGAQFVAEAHKLSQQTMDLFDRMATIQITSGELDELLAAAYPYKRSDRVERLEAQLGELKDTFGAQQLSKARTNLDYWIKRAEQSRAFARTIFEGFEADNPAVKGTLWAAYNAVVEAEDFGTSRESAMPSVQESALFGARADVKVRALERAQVIATVR